MDVFNFKCKYCGGELEAIEGLKSVGKCKYCGSKQTLPKLENEKRANLFERANHLRRNNEFDKAEALYEQLLNEDLTDPEAYWSLVLCRYGIEYVEDKRSGERLPTVNRMQMTSILGDEDYKSAIANADAEQRALYEEEAKLINEIQKGILEIARKEEPFDIFICYKETDADGRRSRDSILAQDLYHELTRDGYRVFFARVTLQGKLGSAYEPYIFSALNSAKVMVVLGTKKEHFEAVWVRNEWSRFLGQIKKGERKVLIPAYRDMDAYDLPVEFSNLQAMDMSRLGFLQELVEGVENILKAYKKKEAPAPEPAPAPTPAPTPKSAPTSAPKAAPEKKKKSKAPIVIIALILALAIGGGALFMSGALDPLFGGGETEAPTEYTPEAPTDPIWDGTPTETPTQEPYETDGESETQSVNGDTETDTETDTEADTEGNIGAELEIEGAVTSLEEGKAYLGVLAHKNLGKLLYLTGTMYNEYYLAETDDIDSAANVYFEKSESINYYMYFLNVVGDKSYVNITSDGTYLDINIDVTPETVWHYNETYRCLMTNINGELVFLGTSDEGTYENICVKRISEGASFFKLQLIVSPNQPVEPPVEESLEFEINEFGDEYSVIGLGTVKATSVVVPDTYNGKPVTAIGDGAFEGSALTNVTISSNIKLIGNRAFANTRLISVTIPDSVTSVGAEAFAECASLSSVEMGEGLTYISESMFKKCARLTQAEIPPSVTYIAATAFAESGITSVTIPDSVTTIVYGAFMDCDALREVTLGVGVTQIEDAVFSGCESLTTVTYAGSPEDFENISIGESNAFFTRVEVECLIEPEIAVKDAVTNIEEGKAYLGVLAQKNLGKYIYLNGAIDGYYLGAVDSKESSANVYFEKSNGINYYMYFLEGDTRVYVNLFLNGSYINFTLDYTPNTEWHYNDSYKCPVANVDGELVFLGTSNTGEYGNFVAKRVGEIKDYFVMQLTVSPNQPEQKPIIPDGEQTLEFELDGATDSYRVVGLGSVTGEHIVIPSTYNGKPVKFIGARAFEACIDMKSIEIPKSIVHIDDYAFNNCINLVHIIYEASYEEWMEINTSIWGNDCLRNEGMKMEYGQIAADPEPENLDFSFVWAPDGESFYVAGLWEYADPTKVIIPEMHKGLFVTGINDYAFQAQDVITSLYIPATVSYIGENAFAECPNLSKVEFEGTAATWKGIHIGNGNEMLINAEIIYEVILGECQHKNLGMESCTVYCTDCGDTIDTEHQSTELVESVDPTESKGGYIKYKCNECGETWTETFPPLGNGGGSDSDTEKTVMSAQELKTLIGQINNGSVRNDITINIGSDLDFTGIDFEPIHEFRGTINGNGWKISNITLTESGSYQTIYDGNGRKYLETVCVGLISQAYDVTVKDLTIEGMTANINSTGNVFIGALAAYANRLSVQGCTINSDFTLNVNYSSGTSGVSGLVGYSVNTAVTGSDVNTKIRYTANSREAFAGSLLCIGNLRTADSAVQMDIVYNSNGGYGHTGYIIGMGNDTGSDAPTTITGSSFRGKCTASNGYAAGVIGQVDYTNQPLVDSILSNNTVTVNNEDNGGGDESEDTGTSDGEVRTVSSASELNALISQINNGKVSNTVTIELSDNIDMKDVTFVPLKDFRGVFDGKGYSISNIALTGKGTTATVRDGNSDEYQATVVGFIASATDATIKNLTLDYVTMNTTPAGDVFVGALLGWANRVNVTDCEVRSDLSVMIGSSDIGGVSGLIGFSNGAVSLTGVSVNSTITATLESTESYTGAAVADCFGTFTIDTCTFDINISSTSGGTGHTGSLIGMQQISSGYASIVNSTVSGTIESNEGTYYNLLIGEGYFYTPDTNSIVDMNELKNLGNTFDIKKLTNK